MIDRAARRQSTGVDGDDSSAEQIVAGHLDDAMPGELAKVLVVLGEVIVRVRSVHRFQAEERVQVFLVVYVAQSLLQVPVLLEQVIVRLEIGEICTVRLRDQVGYFTWVDLLFASQMICSKVERGKELMKALYKLD